MPRELEFVECGPADATASVIWLHGLGADGWDFYPIVPELRLPASAKVRFVFPHAEARPVTLNGGIVMRAWYDIRALDLADRSHDERGIRASAEQIAALIAAEGARDIPAERIVVAGFSQGAAMALHVGLRYPRRLRGIVALSSYLLLPSATAAEAAPANAGQEIFQAHGTDDDVIPVAAGVAARQQLEALGHRVEWRTYPLPHAVNAEEIADIGRWLSTRLAS